MIPWQSPRRQLPPAPAAPRSLLDVPAGGRARVVGFHALPAPLRERLQAYGLAEGRQVRVVQQRPVTVVEVEHSELAIERELARMVRVEAVEAARPFPEEDSMKSKPRKPRYWMLYITALLMSATLFGIAQLAISAELKDVASGLIMGMTILMLAFWCRVERDALREEARQRTRKAEVRPATAVQQHYRQVMMRAQGTADAGQKTRL